MLFLWPALTAGAPAGGRVMTRGLWGPASDPTAGPTRRPLGDVRCVDRQAKTVRVWGPGLFSNFVFGEVALVSYRMNSAGVFYSAMFEALIRCVIVSLWDGVFSYVRLSD